MATIDIKSPEWLAFQASASEIYTEWLLGSPSGVDEEGADDSVLGEQMAVLRGIYGWTDEAVAEAEQKAYNAIMADDTYVERRDS